MSQQWFYQHDSKTHGPVSSEEIRELARRGLLKKTDLLWAEGKDPKSAAPAHAAMDFNKLPLVSFPAPDWLEDVERTQRIGPLPPLRRSKEVPEWLEDLRLWVALDVRARGKAAGSLPEMEKEKENEKGKGGKRVEPVARRVEPVASPGVLAPPPVVASSPAAPGTGELPAKVGGAHPTAEVPRPATVLAQKLLLETGFDLETGQILDAVKFAKWKHQKASQESATAAGVSNASLFEVFRKARTAIENWVDDDANRSAVMHSTIEEIGEMPEVREIFQRYENYGSAMREKILQHLEFMAGNRKKYYTARHGT